MARAKTRWDAFTVDELVDLESRDNYDKTTVMAELSHEIDLRIAEENAK